VTALGTIHLDLLEGKYVFVGTISTLVARVARAISFNAKPVLSAFVFAELSGTIEFSVPRIACAFPVLAHAIIRAQVVGTAGGNRAIRSGETRITQTQWQILIV